MTFVVRQSWSKMLCVGFATDGRVLAADLAPHSLGAQRPLSPSQTRSHEAHTHTHTHTHRQTYTPAHSLTYHTRYVNTAFVKSHSGLTCSNSCKGCEFVLVLIWSYANTYEYTSSLPRLTPSYIYGQDGKFA